MTRSIKHAALAVLILLLALCLGIGLLCLQDNVKTAYAAEGDHTGHDTGWTALTADSGALTGGNYYLEGDLTADLTVSANATVTLCLNGHVLTGTGGGSVITVNGGANFTLCDCQSESTAAEHQHAYYVDGDGLYVFDDGTDGWDTAYAAAGTEGKGTIVGGVVTGGSISGQSLSSCGGGIRLLENVRVQMDGGAIAGNSAVKCGGGVGMLNSSAFIMNNGVIAGNITTLTYGTYGAGVFSYGDKASFTMNNGRIYENSNALYGGGIAVQGTTVVLNGGVIENHTVGYDGGGLHIGSYSDPDAMISFGKKGSLTVQGTAIVRNNHARSGGGICASYADIWIKDSASVSGNSSNNTGTNPVSNRGGGGIVVEDSRSKLVLEGGTIRDNSAVNFGGGIFVSCDTTISGTLIAGNKVTSGTAEKSGGGGVYIYTGTVDMSSGQIMDNEVVAEGEASGGGGVYLYGGYFNLSGGSVIGNSSTKNGGGVYFNKNFTVQGAPVVENNHADGRIGNVYVLANTPIGIAGALISGAQIGVSLQDQTDLFAEDYSLYNQQPISDYFFSDDSDFKTSVNQNGEAVLLKRYTIVYVLPGGVQKIVDVEFDAPVTMLTAEDAAVEIGEGILFGWTPYIGGESIIYVGGSVIDENLAGAGEVITLYAVQVRDIASDVDGVIADLENAVAGVNAALEGGSAADLQGALEALIKAYEAADTALASDFAAADTNLKTELEKAIGEAKTALQASIDAVQTGLEEAVADLQAAIEAIEANDGDIAALNEELAALKKSYEAADALIEADIAALESADEEIEGQISSLQEELQAADDALGEALDSVEAQLKAAVEALQALYADGEAPADLTLAAGMKELVAQLQAAQAAIEALGTGTVTDAELSGAVDDLEALISQAESALQSAIGGVEAQLKAAVEELEAAIAANASDTAQKLAAVEEAYKAADALLDADITALQGEAGQLEAALADLDAAYKAADEAIWQAIEQLQGTVGTHTAVLWVLAVAVVLALGVGAAGLVLALKRRG